jgi:chromosome segregation ATPase
MNTPLNTSLNYEAIQEHLQQQIDDLKTWLSVKDTRLDLLVAQLKETQTELEATQTKLEANQRELEATQRELGTTKTGLKTI